MTTNKDIVETALSFEGKLNYEWGGDNIAGGYGDCSDFTQYVYAVHGINIGGYTGSQIEHGYSVLKEDLQAGDLVFFKDTMSSKKGLSHVGIYIGNGKFIHLSSGKDKCVVDNLNSEYWTAHYMDARRSRSVTYDENYSGESSGGETVTESVVRSETVSDLGLKWWGDIVKVVLVAIVAIAGVALLAMSAGTSLSNISTKVINKTVKEVVEDGN